MHATLQQKMFKVFVLLIFCIKVKLAFHCFASVRIGGLQHHAASPLSRINGSQCCVGTATQTHTHTHTKDVCVCSHTRSMCSHIAGASRRKGDHALFAGVNTSPEASAEGNESFHL